MNDTTTKIALSERIRRLWHDRTAQTLTLGAVLVVLFGFVRPPAMVDRVGVDHTYIFLYKTHSPKKYDMVIGGDSRAYCSLSPAVMRKSLGTDESILNFAFEANGYTEPYLKGITAKLDRSAPAPTVVLAFTPMSLVPSTAYWNGYENCLDKTGWALYRDMYMPRLLHYFEPYEWRYIYRRVMGETPIRYVWRYDADGFVSVQQFPEVREVNVEKQHSAFKNNTVKEARIELVMDWVRKWTSEGISVYGYRPPASAQVVKIEDTEGGFDQDEIVRRFQEAGGVWVDVGSDQYATYDGYHLLGHEAVRFSSKFAAKMLADGWNHGQPKLTLK